MDRYGSTAGLPSPDYFVGSETVQGLEWPGNYDQHPPPVQELFKREPFTISLAQNRRKAAWNNVYRAKVLYL